MDALEQQAAVAKLATKIVKELGVDGDAREVFFEETDQYRLVGAGDKVKAFAAAAGLDEKSKLPAGVGGPEPEPWPVPGRKYSG